jgi:hypothetical protein
MDGDLRFVLQELVPGWQREDAVLLREWLALLRWNGIRHCALQLWRMTRTRVSLALFLINSHKKMPGEIIRKHVVRD